MSRRSLGGESAPAPGILIEIRQGGRLIAALPLAAEPIEMTLRDIRSGLPLGTLVAKGPTLSGVDEQPVPKLSRPPEDDFTLPFPERSETVSALLADAGPEPTGDLEHTDPETETAEAPRPAPPPRAQSVPNLARAQRIPDTDENTSPAVVPVSALPEHADEEPSRTVPRPTAVSGLPQRSAPSRARQKTQRRERTQRQASSPRNERTQRQAKPPRSEQTHRADEALRREETLSAHLEDLSPGFGAGAEDTVGSLLVEATRSQVQREETLGAHLVDAAPSSRSRKVPPAPKGSRKPPLRRLENVPPAEVWTRNASEWRTAGRLLPGQRTAVQQGWVELDDSGRLLVYAGPEMSGTATLVNGRTVEIKRNGQRVRLPPGSSVILRGPGHGLYVRADPPSPGR